MSIQSIAIRENDKFGLTKVHFDPSGVGTIVGENGSGKSEIIDLFSKKEKCTISFLIDEVAKNKFRSLPLFFSQNPMWKHINVDTIFVKDSCDKSYANLLDAVINELKKQSDAFAQRSAVGSQMHQIFVEKIRAKHDHNEYEWIAQAIAHHPFLNIELSSDADWLKTLSAARLWRDETKKAIFVHKRDLQQDPSDKVYAYLYTLDELDESLTNSFSINFVNHILQLANVSAIDIVNNIQNIPSMQKCADLLGEVVAKKLQMHLSAFNVTIEGYHSYARRNPSNINPGAISKNSFVIAFRVNKSYVLRSDWPFISQFFNSGNKRWNTITLIDNFGDGLTPFHQQRLRVLTSEMARFSKCRFVLATNNMFSIAFNKDPNVTNTYLCTYDKGKKALVQTVHALHPDHKKILDNLKYYEVEKIMNTPVRDSRYY